MMTSSTFQASGIAETYIVNLGPAHTLIIVALLGVGAMFSAAGVAAPTVEVKPTPSVKPAAKSSADAKLSKPVVKPTGAASKQASVPRSSNVNRAPGRKVMVPPPPPDIPLIGRSAGMEFSTIGVPLDFMAKPDLERMKTRLEQSLTQLTSRAEERRTTIADLKARLTQFESLYTEGVVSKKDLKGVRKELAEAQETDVDVDQRLSDVKSDLARVCKRLKALDKSTPDSAKKK